MYKSTQFGLTDGDLHVIESGMFIFRVMTQTIRFLSFESQSAEHKGHALCETDCQQARHWQYVLLTQVNYFF
jgi:hypothetical protein